MQAKKLVKMLEEASAAYYGGTPIISDPEFDALRDQLFTIDPDNPFLKKVGSAISVSAWPKVKHEMFIGSQAKVNTKEEWDNWKKDKKGVVQISHKLDGSTIVLTYRAGELQCAATRGDGEHGDDITPNVLKMKNVKKTLPVPFTGQLRGEMILTKANYEKHFKPIGYKNARNTANGVARDKKGTDKLKHIEARYFDAASETGFHSEESKRKMVESMGLTYVDTQILMIDKVWEYFEKFDRGSLQHDIDGLVVKLDLIEEQEKYGVVDGRPKGQVSIKFEAASATTKLNDITWQVGLSGRITPVAELESVELDGVTIKRSTLNNLDYIQALNLEIGDELIIARQNDVIPAVIGVAKKSNSGKGINLPRNCPTCGEILERDGAYIICAFTECAGAVFGNMMTWVKIHNMLGFGTHVLSGLIDLGIDTPDKFYTAELHALSQASGSDKVAVKLKTVIEQTREMTIDKFLAGLNISHLGKTNSKRLAKEFGTLDEVLNAKPEEFASIEGIKTTAKKIHSGLIDKRGQIDKLLEHVEVKTLNKSGPLKGKAVAMTGLRSYNGHDLGELIQNSGGELKSGVSKGLDLLIIKDPSSTSNKAEKARKYGTKLISPDEFLELVGHA